jgi:Glycosyltransferase family 87
MRYWTGIVAQTGRIGNPAYAGNQSIQAILTRAWLDPWTSARRAGWLVLSVAVLVVACRGMRHAFAASENSQAPTLSFSLNNCASWRCPGRDSLGQVVCAAVPPGDVMAGHAGCS